MSIESKPKTVIVILTNLFLNCCECVIKIRTLAIETNTYINTLLVGVGMGDWLNKQTNKKTQKLTKTNDQSLLNVGMNKLYKGSGVDTGSFYIQPSPMRD